MENVPDDQPPRWTVPPPGIALPELSAAEQARYDRHLILPEVGPLGQRRLKAASAVVVGAGGLGAPLGLYLAAAGVGRIGVVDFDTVDTSNLHRQVLFSAADVGRPKLLAMQRRLADVNPHVRVELHQARLTSANALELLGGYDVVLDGTDNFATRYLVNDACVLLGKPNVYGSIFRFEGQVSVFWAQHGPCYRCLYPEPPPPGLVPSCAEGGVLGVLPGIVGTLQANEAIKLMLGAGEPLLGRLLLVDALSARLRELKLRKDPSCPVCGPRPTITSLIDYDRFCGTSAAPQEVDAGETTVAPGELRRRLVAGGITLLDVRNPDEWQRCHLEGATLIPLPQLTARAHELDPSAEIVVYCKMGGRSSDAAAYLRRTGFARVRHLRGGLDAWRAEVDPSLPYA